MTVTDFNSILDNDKQAITGIISSEIYPITVKEIRRKLILTGRSIPDYLITRVLRNLLSEGQLRYKAGRWMNNELFEQINIIQTGFVPRSIERPKLSQTGEQIFQSKGTDKAIIDTSKAARSKDFNGSIQRGPWSTFRNLLSYYTECIRNEEGAEASAFIDEIGKKYLYANGLGKWYPRTNESWNYVIPVGPHVADFFQNLYRNSVDNIVVFGYPIEAVHIKRDNEPDTKLIRPVFQYILDVNPTKNSITLSTSNAQPEISLEWMKYAFKNYSEQFHFLSSCGLISQQRPDDEPIGFTSEDKRPDIDELAKTLSSFMSKRIREPLNCLSVNPHPLPSEFNSGIYNRAVFMIGNRTKFTQTLLKELAHIGLQPDNILEQTSLKYIFKEAITAESDDDEKPHEATVADVLPLNAEQREAASSLLAKNITVVTGPPGTGKSQVVMGAVANSRFKDKSVLFASRNHKAIDAVVNRLKDRDGNSLIIRANSKDDPNLKMTFKKAIISVQTTNLDVEVAKSYEQKLLQLDKLLKERGQHATVLDQVHSLRDKIGEIEEKLSWLQEDLSKRLYDIIYHKYVEVEIGLIKRFKRLITSLNKYTDKSADIKNHVNSFSWLRMIPLWSASRKILNTFSDGQMLSHLPPFTRSKVIALDIKRLNSIVDCLSALHDLLPLVDELKQMPFPDVMVKTIKELTEKIEIISVDLLSLNIQSCGGISLDGSDRQKISYLDSALTTLEQGFTDESQRTEASTNIIKYAPVLLKYFPCWAVTNLSVGSRIPIAPGLFDLAIIDEASQCDIASAIPILFRAKRAAVVGDPNQLKHVSKLSAGKDALLRKRSNLTELEDIRFSYREKSLYDLFAQTTTISPHLLRDTYRSCEEIAEYSNRVFYNGVLRVATNDKYFKTPAGTKAGLHWTNVVGPVVSAGKSGCVSEKEVVAVYEIIKKILVENNFKGTVGVVTPFRQQQLRLQDRIFDTDIPFDRLNQANVIVDTAHGFQGDERDVMIFSLCAGPDMPNGSMFFIRDNANLFNVSVSRAKAVLHVVGNREWAIQCGIKHIEQLAQHRKNKVSHSRSGPWSPHESPWEKLLYETLLSQGIEAIPQYPVAGRRLDLALVDEKTNLKIDIEVDSDRYHRNPDGSRKKDDTWRDIYLMSMGWKVMRFWVYNLKENMKKCVSEIEEAWRSNE